MGSNCSFDGKIGIWPFVRVVLAQRNSVHRDAGTPEIKNITVDAETYMNSFLTEVLPAISDKWPDAHGEIFIQHDGAPSHFKDENEDWLLAAAIFSNVRQLNLKLKYQAPNSPDTNILDLGFFRSLQSLQFQQEPATTTVGLMNNVRRAFDEYDPKLLNRAFITHQDCMGQIIEEKGGNDYSISHMGKDRLEREGQLPVQLPVGDAAWIVLEETLLLP